MGRGASLARRAPAPRSWAGGALALVLLLPRALAAQAAAEVTPQGPPLELAKDSPADAAASAEARSAAALAATQELEARVIELRRELDGMARERASFEDLRRRLDELEARQGQLRQSGPEDWTEVGGDGLHISRDGLEIRSPGNRFLLRPGLRLQGLYGADLAARGAVDDARPDSSAFALAHAELLFEGHAWSPRFEFRLELDFAETTPEIAKDAFVQWRFAREHALRVGQFKVPYGLETQYWNALLEFVDVARATAAFSLDRDVGLMLVGRPLGGRLQYYVAATNGPRAPCPRNVDGLRCDQIDLAYAARVVAAPFGPLPAVEGDLVGERHPLLSVGVSGAYLLLPSDVRARTGVMNAPIDVDGNGRVDNVGVLQGAVELRALFQGASLQAEWFGRREHPGAAVPDRSYWGAYAQAGYFVLAHRLQVVGRVGRTDLPLYGVLATDRLLQGTRTTEESGGLSAYLRGHDAKLQLNYTHLSTPDAESAPSIHRLLAAAQLAF